MRRIVLTIFIWLSLSAVPLPAIAGRSCDCQPAAQVVLSSQL